MQAPGLWDSTENDANTSAVDVSEHAPLAERMRPRTLAEFTGQEHLLGQGRILERMIANDNLSSLIFWGPPGCGKTTLAHVIANETKSHFIFFSAILSGIKEIREIFKEAEGFAARGRRTILFIDEIHRFNKSQQDAFLPYVERGVVTIIGATTENPSFEVIAPLLSRCRVLTLNQLGTDTIKALLRNALQDRQRGLGKLGLDADDDALEFLAEHCGGDARIALNTLEVAAGLLGSGTGEGEEAGTGDSGQGTGKDGKAETGDREPGTVKTQKAENGNREPSAPGLAEEAGDEEEATQAYMPIHRGADDEGNELIRPKAATITLETVQEALQKKALLYDKGGEEHYNVISAFIKSMRASNPDAALYWLARMIEAGEDPMFILRRMIILASEDIGNADPRALQIAVSAMQAFQMVGMPEGRIIIVQAVTYLATAPKSNASYMGINEALAEVRKSGALPVPMHIRNAPTKLMKELGYNKGYQYDHDTEKGYSGQECLPEKLAGRKFYAPKGHGYEKNILERMDWLKKIKK